MIDVLVFASRFNKSSVATKIRFQRSKKVELLKTTQDQLQFSHAMILSNVCCGEQWKDHWPWTRI